MSAGASKTSLTECPRLLCNLLQYPRNNWSCALSNLPQPPRNNWGGGLSGLPCKNKTLHGGRVAGGKATDREGAGRNKGSGPRGPSCHNTPVKTENACRKPSVTTPRAGARSLHQYPRNNYAGWLPFAAWMGRGEPCGICYNTPVTNDPFCYNTPVTNRAFCYNTPVTTAAQVVDYQRFNFLEILLERVLESRPADSPARAGGPMPANRGLQDKEENTGRTFQKEAAGLAIVRATDYGPAGPNTL
jgi:hypothetical protein